MHVQRSSHSVFILQMCPTSCIPCGHELRVGCLQAPPCFILCIICRQLQPAHRAVVSVSQPCLDAWFVVVVLTWHAHDFADDRFLADGARLYRWLARQCARGCWVARKCLLHAVNTQLQQKKYTSKYVIPASDARVQFCARCR